MTRAPRDAADGYGSMAGAEVQPREVTSAERFAQVAMNLHDPGGMDETVDAVVGLALQALNCSHAGVALVVARRQLEIPAVTDPVVSEIYPVQVAIAHILARHASVAVATARHEKQLVAAVDARKLVGQAMGILMERFDVDGDRAFAILERYSQDTNRKLRDVAQELIDTRKLPR